MYEPQVNNPMQTQHFFFNEKEASSFYKHNIESVKYSEENSIDFYKNWLMHPYNETDQSYTEQMDNEKLIPNIKINQEPKLIVDKEELDLIEEYVSEQLECKSENNSVEFDEQFNLDFKSDDITNKIFNFVENDSSQIDLTIKEEDIKLDFCILDDLVINEEEKNSQLFTEVELQNSKNVISPDVDNKKYNLRKKSAMLLSEKALLLKNIEMNLNDLKTSKKKRNKKRLVNNDQKCSDMLQMPNVQKNVHYMENSQLKIDGFYFNHNFPVVPFEMNAGLQDNNGIEFLNSKEKIKDKKVKRRKLKTKEFDKVSQKNMYFNDVCQKNVIAEQLIKNKCNFKNNIHNNSTKNKLSEKWNFIKKFSKITTKSNMKLSEVTTKYKNEAKIKRQIKRKIVTKKTSYIEQFYKKKTKKTVTLVIGSKNKEQIKNSYSKKFNGKKRILNDGSKKCKINNTKRNCKYTNEEKTKDITEQKTNQCNKRKYDKFDSSGIHSSSKKVSSSITLSKNKNPLNNVLRIKNIHKRFVKVYVDFNKYPDKIKNLYSIRGKELFCAICPYSSIQKPSMIVHTRRHIGEKPFKCDICPYASVEKSHILRHKKIHSGEKPHKCPYCPYASIQKVSLRYHIKKHDFTN